MTEATIEQVFREHSERWIALEGVLGVSVEKIDGAEAINVYVESKTEEIEGSIPREVGGFPVRIEETGAVSPFGFRGKTK